MVRPRGAGFHYNDTEFEFMKADAKLLMENGSDGLAFVCLDCQGNIDQDKTKQIIDIIKEYNGEVVFHRSLDCANDAY